MIKCFPIIITLLFLTESLYSQVGGNIDLNDGLIVHYPFSGDANDQSGNEHHGVVFGATLIEDRFDCPNSAYSFDGDDDFIDLPDSDLLHLDFPLSLSLWARADENASSYDAGVFDSDFVENNYHGIFAGFNTFHGSLGASFGDGSGSTSINSRRTVSHSVPIITEIYHHMVVVFKSSTTMELYFNNELVSTIVAGNGGNEIEYSIAGGVIGKTDNSTSEPNINFFQGEIDDIRMYDRALSADDIDALFNETKGRNIVSFLDTTLCFGDSIFFDDRWVFDTGVYIEEISSGCDSVQNNLDLIIEDSLLINITYDEIIHPNVDFQITTSEDQANPVIQWTPGDGLSCTDCLNPIVNIAEDKTYNIEITNELGCVVTKQVKLIVDPVLMNSQCDFYVPNVITLNSPVKTINQYFFLQSSIDCSFQYNLFLYDRWGSEVGRFNSINTNVENEGWFATEFPNGVYTYYIEILALPKPNVLFGSITLIR